MVFNRPPFVMRAARFLALLASPIVLGSCAIYSTVQPQVNSYVVAHRPEKALQTLTEDPGVYGSNNALLYWLDRGMVLQLLGRYDESVHAFEKAKHLFDELYTKSVSRAAATWLVNDYMAPYPGEDFEYVLVNVFQALNFAAEGNFSEALVEARAADHKLRVVNDRYPPSKKNVYRDDAFVRMMMGIFYELNGTPEDINDAYISYSKALDIYEGRFARNFGVPTPKILKENLWTTAQDMGGSDAESYRDRFFGSRHLTLEEKRQKAEVYLVHYNGFSPIKTPEILAFPVGGWHVTKLSFPRYHERVYQARSSKLVAVDQANHAVEAPTEQGENITEVAKAVLEQKRGWLTAKSILRPAGKLALQLAAEQAAEEKSGEGARDAVLIAGDIYALASEQADLRCWATLPAEIRVARLLLPPGTYTFSINTFDDHNRFLETKPLGQMSLQAGDKKVLVTRTYQ